MGQPEAVAPKWWGWGDPSKRLALSDAALAMLRAELGAAEPAERVSVEEVGLPEPRPIPDRVVATVGADSILDSNEQRIRRAAGKSYPDLVRMRSGRLERAPDAIVIPADAAVVGALLEACAREGVAVVPFGGGTSVVGGVDPDPGAHDRLISLDLRRLRGVEVNGVSMTVTLGPGLRGPEAEAALASQGLTIGHFPQSFEYATIGGFAATRSAGQASAGYGRFDDLVTSIALTSPEGELRTLATPHTAAGPSLRELILGSEGTLGVITEATVRVREAPERRRYEGWIAADFAAGRELIRSLAQADALPDVTRLSDEAETRISLGIAGTRGLRRAALDAYLSLRRRSGGCLVICGWEGSPEAVDRARARSAPLLRAGGAVSLGEAPGRAWERGRYEGPYLRDELWTSATWSRRSRRRTPGPGSVSSTRPWAAPWTARCATRERPGW